MIGRLLERGALVASLLLFAGACTQPHKPSGSSAPAAISPSAASNPSAGAMLALQVPGMHLAEVFTHQYRSDGNSNLELDLYKPIGETQKLPVVLLLHGVTRRTNPKSFGAIVGWGQALASRGLAAAAINYRPDAGGQGEEGSADIRAAVAFLREHKEDLRIDSDRVALIGFSGAGPFLVAAAFDPANQPIGAIASFYAAVEHAANPAGPQRQSLSTQLRLCPSKAAFIAGGAGETDMGIRTSIDQFRSAVQRDWDVTIEIHEAAGHGFDYEVKDDRSREIIKAALDFLVKHLELASSKPC